MYLAFKKIRMSKILQWWHDINRHRGFFCLMSMSSTLWSKPGQETKNRDSNVHLNSLDETSSFNDQDIKAKFRHSDKLHLFHKSDLIWVSKHKKSSDVCCYSINKDINKTKQKTLVLLHLEKFPGCHYWGLPVKYQEFTLTHAHRLSIMLSANVALGLTSLKMFMDNDQIFLFYYK